MSEEMIVMLKEGLIIPVIYMICYLFWGREKSLSGIISPLKNSIVLYLTGVISFIMVKSLFKDFSEITLGTKIVGIFLSVIFSIPFISSLIKSIRLDFYFFHNIRIEAELSVVLRDLFMIVILVFAVFICFLAFFTGEASIEVLLCGICFLFGLLLVIKRVMADIAKIDLKISDKFIASGIIISIVLMIIFLPFA